MSADLRFNLVSIWKGGGVKQAGKDLGGLTKQAGKTSDALKELGLTVAKGAMVMGVAKLIKDSTVLAARVETLGVVTAHMGEQMGMTETQVRSLEQSIVDQGITLQNSRQMIAMMIQSNIDLGEATDLARMAQDAAVIANINSSEAAKKLVYVLQTGNVRMARTLGLNVQFGQSYKALAKEIGVNVDALNEEQIMQARVNAVKEAGARISGVYEKAMGTAGKQLLSLDRYVEEFKVALGTLFIPALGKAVEALTKFFKTMRTGLDTLDLWINANQKIIDIIKEHNHEVALSEMTYAEYVNELRRVGEETGKLVGTVEWYRETAGSAAGATAAMAANIVILTKQERENLESTENLHESWRLSEQILSGTAGAAEVAADAIRGLTSAQYLEKAAEAVLAGDYAAAQYFSDMAHQAEIAEGNTRRLIEALDALDGKKVTSEIWIQTFGASELGIIGSQQAGSFVPTPPKIDHSLDPRSRAQHGGKLNQGITLVGEAGPELIIGNVVVPADLSRRLMGLGIEPGGKFQKGGSFTKKGSWGTPPPKSPGTLAPKTIPYGDKGVQYGAPIYSGGSTTSAITTAVSEAITEIAPVIEEAIPEAVEAAVSATALQIGAMQAAITAQTQQARLQNSLLKDILAGILELATDAGVAESILSGLQTADFG